MEQQHPANTIDFIEFPVQDLDTLQRSRHFFTQVFGWAFTSWGEDYADTTDSGLGAGLNADPAHQSSQPLAVIQVPDLAAAHEAVLRAGGRITRPIFSFPGGRRFHFQEPSGNELAAWSPHEPPDCDACP